MRTLSWQVQRGPFPLKSGFSELTSGPPALNGVLGILLPREVGLPAHESVLRVLQASQGFIRFMSCFYCSCSSGNLSQREREGYVFMCLQTILAMQLKARSLSL